MPLRSYSVLSMLLPLIIIMMQYYSLVLSTENACPVYPVKSVSKMELVLSFTIFAI